MLCTVKPVFYPIHTSQTNLSLSFIDHLVCGFYFSIVNLSLLVTHLSPSVMRVSDDDYLEGNLLMKLVVMTMHTP